MRLTALITALGLALWAPPTTAGTPVRVQIACPVDGVEFSFTDTASFSTWGAELDGKPMGSWTTPMPIPQCPGSNFPVYRRDFDANDKAKIKVLVETPEYQAIKDEAPYYVLRFVLPKIEPDSEADPDFLLLAATWQARDKPEAYARYVSELVPLMDAKVHEQTAQDTDWWWRKIIVANLLRQVGDFEGATARLDALSGAPPAQTDFGQRVALTRSLIAARDSRPQAVDSAD